jgi:crotonobetainyl-CoA:carnitine CoA-transferase CaiB-like acyl-CoA transferase
VMADPHIKARKMVVDIDHPKIGPMKTLGLPIKSSGDLTAIRKPAPMLGQHSEEIVRGLGYGDAEIQTLFSEQVIFDSCRDPSRSTA